MDNMMSFWGVGPLFLVLAGFYGVTMIVITATFYPMFQVRPISYSLMFYLGIIFLVVGIPFYIISVIQTKRAYDNEMLFTGGVFRYCRNPIYSSWTIFIVPGIAFFVNSWLFLSTPIFMYFILKQLVKKEEVYLLNRFGEEYKNYLSKVPCIIPYGFLKK